MNKAEFHQGLNTSTVILSQNTRYLKLIYRKENHNTRYVRVMNRLLKIGQQGNRVLNNNIYLIMMTNHLSLLGLEVRAFLECEIFQYML